MKHADAAIHCEMKKVALRQSKDGIIVSFVLHPHEVPKQLQTADIGSRWMVALVELNDDETPVQYQPAKEHSEAVGIVQEAEKERSGWRDLTPVAQCGIRCHDPVFRKFLNEVYKAETITEDDAAKSIRKLCSIKSRSELSINHRARVLWHQMDEQFLAWKQV